MLYISSIARWKRINAISHTILSAAGRSARRTPLTREGLPLGVRGRYAANKAPSLYFTHILAADIIYARCEGYMPASLLAGVDKLPAMP